MPVVYLCCSTSMKEVRSWVCFIFKFKIRLGIVSELMSDSFRAACFSVWSMLLLCSQHWWLRVVMCYFRVWFIGKTLGSVSHYSITITIIYTRTQRHTRIHTLRVFMSSADIELVSLEPHTKPYYAFSFFSQCVKEWLQFIRMMKHWGHSQGCKSFHTWVDGKIWKSVPLSRARDHFIECECITDTEDTLVCAVFKKNTSYVIKVETGLLL